jgi:RNA-binding protein NOB1
MEIDSGAIIKGCGFDFHKVASRFWTVQEVLAEIRDSKSLHLLETLPFELEVRAPSEKAMKAVADFARKTNDFAALSLTDLKLIALTYQFELEANGTKYIRTEPASLMKAKVVSPVSFIVHS